MKKMMDIFCWKLMPWSNAKFAQSLVLKTRFKKYVIISIVLISGEPVNNINLLICFFTWISILYCISENILCASSIIIIAFLYIQRKPWTKRRYLSLCWFMRVLFVFLALFCRWNFIFLIKLCLLQWDLFVRKHIV